MFLRVWSKMWKVISIAGFLELVACISSMGMTSFCTMQRRRRRSNVIYYYFFNRLIDLDISKYGTRGDLSWLPSHFHQFLVVACLAKFLVLIHLFWKLLGIACLLQYSMLAGLLLKYHTCNQITCLLLFKNCILSVFKDPWYSNWNF